METNLPTSFNPENYILEPGTHHDKRVIWISFHFNQELKEQLKSSCKAHWSRTGKKWYVVDNLHHRKLLGMEPNYYGKAAFLEVAPINQPALQRMVEQLQLRGYSPNTVRTYATEFVQLLKILKDYPVHELSPEKLRSYFLYCINRLKLSENLIHSRMNAVKFYFEQVLHRERMFLEIPRPKKPSLLPKAISATDIKKMLATIENPKHLLLLKLCYGMGLRVSEIVNMKITDIDTKTMQVLVNQSKGKKDRYVGLPESVLHELRSYYAVYKPKKYLFEGQSRGQYSVRSVQSVFKKAMKEANINKTVGIHSLRHSYATHLIEQGTDIRFVQELLGHNSIKTTMIYTNLTDQAKRQIKSPLDRL